MGQTSELRRDSDLRSKAFEMSITTVPQIVIPGSDKKPIALEISHPEGDGRFPYVIFMHGFKGFKNWGPWYVAANRFAEAGIGFLRFNFSHNGTTPKSPFDFADLEAFGQNNFSRELFDSKAVLDWLTEDEQAEKYKVDTADISLIGHSRGGATGLIFAKEDIRISRVICWAGVSDLSRYLRSDRAEQWKKDGVYHIPNARTGQEMPLYFQLHEDLAKNQERFDVQSAVKRLNRPLMIVQGTDDSAVKYDEAQALKSWAPDAPLLTIKGGNHVFGGRHPWEDGDILPRDFSKVVRESIRFIEQS